MFLGLSGTADLFFSDDTLYDDVAQSNTPAPRSWKVHVTLNHNPSPDVIVHLYRHCFFVDTDSLAVWEMGSLLFFDG